MKKRTAHCIVRLSSILMLSVVIPMSAQALDSINPEQVGQSVASNVEESMKAEQQAQIDQRQDLKMDKLLARLGAAVIVVGAAVWVTKRRKSPTK